MTGLAGLARAPWEELCTEAADVAAEARAALLALEDAGCDVLPEGRAGWSVSFEGQRLGAGSTLDEAVLTALPVATGRGLVTL